MGSCGEDMIELRLEGKGSLGEEEWRRIQNGELLDTIQSAMEDEQGIKWVHRVSFAEEKWVLDERDHHHRPLEAYFAIPCMGAVLHGDEERQTDILGG